jgi:hypothetical protein
MQASLGLAMVARVWPTAAQVSAIQVMACLIGALDPLRCSAAARQNVLLAKPRHALQVHLASACERLQPLAATLFVQSLQ